MKQRQLLSISVRWEPCIFLAVGVDGRRLVLVLLGLMVKVGRFQ